MNVHTLMLPRMSFLTGVKATDPSKSVMCAGRGRNSQSRSSVISSDKAKARQVPKMVVRLSAASKNSVVPMALSLSASMGTSTKDFLRVSTKVPPAGITTADMLGNCVRFLFGRYAVWLKCGSFLSFSRCSDCLLSFRVRRYGCKGLGLGTLGGGMEVAFGTIQSNSTVSLPLNASMIRTPPIRHSDWC